MSRPTAIRLEVGRILADLKLRDRVFLSTKTPMDGPLEEPAIT